MDPVLRVAAELALARGTRMVEPWSLEDACRADGIGHVEVLSALMAANAEGLVQLAVARSTQIVLVALTDAGVLRHAESSRPDMEAVRDRIATAARGAVGRGAVDLAAEVGEPSLLVECVLDQWVRERRVVYSKAPGRRFRIHRVS